MGNARIAIVQVALTERVSLVLECHAVVLGMHLHGGVAAHLVMNLEA